MTNMYKIYNDNQEHRYEKIMTAKQLERTYLPVTPTEQKSVEELNVVPDKSNKLNTTLNLETTISLPTKEGEPTPERALTRAQRLTETKKDTYYNKILNFFDLN